MRQRINGFELRQPFGGGPDSDSFGDLEQRRASIGCQGCQVRSPCIVRACFLLGDEPEPEQRVVHFVGIAGLGPGFLADALDRGHVESSDLGGVFRIKPAPAHHRLRATLFERRVVEIRIRPRRQNLERKRRRLRQIARDDSDLAGFDPSQQRIESLDVHRFVKTIVNRLLHERVVRHFALADEIFGTRDLVGEHRRDQILRAHPLQRRGHLFAAAEARQRERSRGNPAPPRREHRRVQQRLDQDLPHARAMQITRDVLERKAVACRQRNHDRVFGRRRLKLKIEFAAKALAQRQSPRAIDPTAVRRMNDELHAA